MVTLVVYESADRVRRAEVRYVAERTWTVSYFRKAGNVEAERLPYDIARSLTSGQGRARGWVNDGKR
jgi:hypothetical protein